MALSVACSSAMRLMRLQQLRYRLFHHVHATQDRTVLRSCELSSPRIPSMTLLSMFRGHRTLKLAVMLTLESMCGLAAYRLRTHPAR